MNWLRGKRKPPASVPEPATPSVHIGGRVFPARVLKVQDSIAERMGTGFMVCDNCTRSQDLNFGLVIKYLQSGWPVCCQGTLHGGTMRYCRAEERKRG
ncbi:MAG TPA: hypothetical protein VHA06_06995 [Candidatus Angelobacter sp.]|jgi:hypothetical protein|nr:hypothetical protein [Candidatus Angelobacter sp.]